MTDDELDILFEEFRERFKKMTEQELIDEWCAQSMCGGWGSARARYVVALNDEIKNRGLKIGTWRRNRS